jgi:hypothetical protein
MPTWRTCMTVPSTIFTRPAYVVRRSAPLPSYHFATHAPSLSPLSVQAYAPFTRGPRSPFSALISIYGKIAQPPFKVTLTSSAPSTTPHRGVVSCPLLLRAYILCLASRAPSAIPFNLFALTMTMPSVVLTFPLLVTLPELAANSLRRTTDF